MEEGLPLFPEAASTVAGKVDELYFAAVGMSVFFSILISVLLVVLAIRYRRRAGVGPGEEVKGAILLEIFWSAVPLVIALGLFYWGATLYVENTRVPANAMQIRITGKQWMWKAQHPTGQREVNDLHVPVGVPIELTMISEDVIHSYYLPAFRIKRDVLPGRYSRTWFEATKTGEYHIFCAEYCGTKHSEMIGRIHVMERVEYERWLDGAVSGETPRETGEKLFASLRCNTCHNNQSGARGPDLAGRWGMPVELAGGATVAFDEAYVRESILNPAAKLRAGYKPLMPTYAGQVSEEQILALITYIESLAADQGGDQ